MAFVPTVNVIRHQSQTMMNLLSNSQQNIAPGLLMAAQKVAESLLSKISEVYQVDTIQMTMEERIEFAGCLFETYNTLAVLKSQADSMNLALLSENFEYCLNIEENYVR
ncbi:MAG: hypothetical protein N2445_05255, partial [Acidobacteria bacterium]|nr:hypothetical protein [Acidobacteriota bacterium]